MIRAGKSGTRRRARWPSDACSIRLRLVTLDSDLARRSAALAASRAEYERTQKLLASGENTSRKSAENAEAQFRAGRDQGRRLRRPRCLQWGAAFAALDARSATRCARRSCTANRRSCAVDVLPGDALPICPGRALLVLGREPSPWTPALISPAADADPRTQAQGFIPAVDKPPFALRPGMALTAWLELPEKPRAVLRSTLARAAPRRTHVGLRAGRGGKIRAQAHQRSTRRSTGQRAGSSPRRRPAKRKTSSSSTGAQVLLSEEMKAMDGAARGMTPG
jgi:hypothetical protein